MLKAVEHDLKQGGNGWYLTLERMEPLNNTKIITLVKGKWNIPFSNYIFQAFQNIEIIYYTLSDDSGVNIDIKMKISNPQIYESYARHF